MPLVYRALVSVKSLTDNLGLYLHIPFCQKKCRYCDFYSAFCSEKLIDEYTRALIKSIKQWGGTFRNRPIDTIYLGGGTPSLLTHRLEGVIESVKKNFCVIKDTEITLELNPSCDIETLLNYAKKAGVNRLSIGAQSGNDTELLTLGRTHTAYDIEKTVKKARELGFSNISLDLMIGLPDSNLETLGKSLDFITKLDPEHISAYILKIEENTPFYKQKDSLNLPSDENIAEQYLFMCEYLENVGYNHYEISNFSKKGMMSRHNLKYWQGIDYLGLGPAAHSALSGERFYYPRDLKGFINGNTPLNDGKSGGKEEYIMLSLRLSSGIEFKKYKTLFGEDFPQKAIDKANILEKHNLLKVTDKNIYLTNNGMLLSNSIITEILEALE